MLYELIFPSEPHRKSICLAGEAYDKEFCELVLQTIERVVFSILKPRFQMEIAHKNFFATQCTIAKMVKLLLS